MTAQQTTPAANAEGCSTRLARIVLWAIWISLFLGGLTFLFVVMLIVLPNPQNPNPDGVFWLQVTDVIVGTALITAVHVIRWLVWRRLRHQYRWKTLTIAYVGFKVATWAACNFVVFLSLITCLIAHQFWPGLLLAGIGWLLMLMDVPLMRPLRR